MAGWFAVPDECLGIHQAGHEADLERMERHEWRRGAELADRIAMSTEPMASPRLL
ncbi:MAG: hypothetical protein OXF07_15910 [Rhodobacter sp.]|nr:hypothetical protein [Rhodobacter sp.]MCY4169026.1 hypothetical protein [Rhodobacter sp.]MCY4241717.1 hypothetical protein [Rhodobacter sp.]